MLMLVVYCVDLRHTNRLRELDQEQNDNRHLWSLATTCALANSLYRWFRA